VYVPKDPSQKWPILMTRTPYTVSPYGEDVYKEDLGPNVELARTSTFSCTRMCAGGT